MGMDRRDAGPSTTATQHYSLSQAQLLTSSSKSEYPCEDGLILRIVRPRLRHRRRSLVQIQHARGHLLLKLLGKPQKVGKGLAYVLRLNLVLRGQ